MEEGNPDFFLQMNSGVQVMKRMKMFQVRKIITTLFDIATVANLNLDKWVYLMKVEWRETGKAWPLKISL